MNLTIDPNSHVPIYLQIVEGFRSALASGVIQTGDALPSLRTLGLELLVNPNTVQRAYDELEREGLIYSRRGVGMFVAESVVRPADGKVEQAVLGAFKRGIQAGTKAQIPVERLRELFDLALDPTLHTREGA